MRAEENELLTRIGRSAPMGQLLRHYWTPALLSHELVAGGDPVRLRLLGENFLAFRSPDGTVGIVDHLCAHRCASLFYGRNEEGGIRCVYHGWKFRHDGQCIEMPSESPETDYKARVKIAAAAVVERYGIVWAYLGDDAVPPPFPHFDFDLVPQEDISSTFTMRECNWLQALEGDINSCHVGFLHLGGTKPQNFEEGSVDYYRQLPENLAPKYEAFETAYGGTYVSTRHAGPENSYHRIGHFAMPFWTMVASDPLDTVRIKGWVPIDDEHVMLVQISGYQRNIATRDKDGNPVVGTSIDDECLPNGTGWLERFRIPNNRRNDHLIDRQVQRDQSYTGIQGIAIQDQAITESMGPIVDRSKEHLGTSDRMIMLTRRRLMRAARELAENNVAPPGAEEPDVYRFTRAGPMVLARDADWLEEYNRHRVEWSGGTAEPIERMALRRGPAVRTRMEESK